MEQKTEESKLKKWFKRIGVAGLIFFTVKGIIMLLVGGALLKWVGCTGV